MKHVSKLALAIAVLALSAITAVAVSVAVENRVSKESVSAAASDARSIATVPGGIVVWMQPPATVSDSGTQTSDGTIFARMGSETGEEHVSKVADGVSAQLVSGGKAPVLMILGYDGQCHYFAYEPDISEWRKMLTLSERPNASAASGGSIVYTGIEDPGSVCVWSADDSPSSSTRLPSMKDEIASQDGDVSMGPPVSDPSAVVATALVMVDSHIVAFSGNRTACQVTDLPSGTTGELGGGQVDAACAGGDGYLYAALTGPSKGSTMRLLRIDPETLKVVSTLDTGWTPTPKDGPPKLNRVRVLYTESGVTLFASELPQYPRTSASLHVWAVKDGDLAAAAQVPEGAGIDAAYGENGTLLIYGGSAKESVSRLDPVSSQDAAVKQLLAPSGAWVLVAAD